MMKCLKALILSLTIARAFALVTPNTFLGHHQHPTLRSTESTLALGPGEAWAAYNTALESDPLLVKSVTASVILGSADLVGQSFEKSREEKISDEVGIDWFRVARFAIFGLVLQAPWNHFYYLFLDGAIPPTPEQPFSTTNVEKIMIDQFLQAPIFTVLIFVFLGALEGKSVESIQNQLKNDYKSTIIDNCTYRVCVVSFDCS